MFGHAWKLSIHSGPPLGEFLLCYTAPFLPKVNTKVIHSFSTLLEMIKFEHTIFALPFAFLGAILAARGLPGWAASGWILLAMVGARSAAMAFNRLADHRFDSLNPRTAKRALPSGEISRGFVISFVGGSSFLFFFAAWNLNMLAFQIAPVDLLIILGYSLTKRFTPFSHLLLGTALAIAPVGGWVAVRGTLDGAPFLLGLTVFFWVSGFDVIYACQDVDFDRQVGLHSIPQRWGIGTSIWLARISHGMMLICLGISIQIFQLSWISWVGGSVIALLLFYEHSLVTVRDLSRVHIAFFNINGIISVGLFLFISSDLLVNG